MDINSIEFAQFINNLIDQKARTTAKEESQKYGNVRAWDAVITSVSGNTANVHLVGEETIITGLKNKSGVTNLASGDEVYLFSLSSLSNAYIAVAKNKP